MNLNWLGKIGQNLARQMLWSTWDGALTATWDETPTDGSLVYDEATGKYLDPSTGKPPVANTQTVSIPAFFDEAPNIQYKYERWGVNASTDAIAIIPDNFTVPPRTAKFFRATDPTTPLTLVGVIPKADIGIAAPGLPPEVAYQVLHLRRG